MSSEHIKRVAIIGATGRVGGFIAEALVKTGQHMVTGIRRSNSTKKVPDGVNPISANFEDLDSLVRALHDQQFLIIALQAGTPETTHNRIAQAAARAGVQYVMPNAYGGDFMSDSLVREDMASKAVRDRCEEIESLEIKWIALSCGFWYEWSLALGEPCFGISIKDRTATFFDDGKAVRSFSTWEQCGRAIANLLSLPVSGPSPCLADWANKAVYISSFRASQRDILHSVYRVTGTSDEDWKIKNEPSAQRYERGLGEMKAGSRVGFARVLYTRTFFPSGDADFETTRGLDNGALGLEKEDLDTSSKRAVKMVEDGWTPW